MVDTDEGPYYWNEATGETSWNVPLSGHSVARPASDVRSALGTARMQGDPRSAAQHASRIFCSDELSARLAGGDVGRASALPEGWVAVETEDGRYYWNEFTGQTSWEVPSNGLATVSL